MNLQNDNLFSYLPNDYTVDTFTDDEDELYTIAHNIVICATQFAEAVTGVPFEDFDEDREDAIAFVIDNIIKTNKPKKRKDGN